jgi:endogenous inhibitor of DNA gyrase (YacG/DUF329 family)
VQQRTCPTCGKEFEPQTSNQVYCPPSKRDGKGQARSRCARRAMNARQRGTDLDSLPPMVKQFDCAHCGKLCIPGDNVPPHASRFCSNSGSGNCKTAWHLAQRSPRKKWPICRISSRPVPRRWITGPCPECGEAVLRRDNPSAIGYCSTTCKLRQKRRRRRARKRTDNAERVHLLSIVERDGWLCGICGQPIDRIRTDQQGPSIDHIVPLAKGGEHRLSNCQLAHRICNSYKRDLLVA